jgi:addiction module HigA family antidote
MSIQQHNPPHPGAFIRRVYIEPFELTSNEVARKLQVSPSTFNRLLNEKADISPEMALKLSKVLGRSPESWMAMQNNFNLAKAREVVDLDDFDSIAFSALTT